MFSTSLWKFSFSSCVALLTLVNIFITVIYNFLPCRSYNFISLESVSGDLSCSFRVSLFDSLFWLWSERQKPALWGSPLSMNQFFSPLSERGSLPDHMVLYQDSNSEEYFLNFPIGFILVLCLPRVKDSFD